MASVNAKSTKIPIFTLAIDNFNQQQPKFKDGKEFRMTCTQLGSLDREYSGYPN